LLIPVEADGEDAGVVSVEEVVVIEFDVLILEERLEGSRHDHVGDAQFGAVVVKGILSGGGNGDRIDDDKGVVNMLAVDRTEEGQAAALEQSINGPAQVITF